MERTVAFILSTNYAGSHYASLMIGSHSKAAHVGEVCHLRRTKTAKAICARCGSLQACPLFKDVRPETIDDAYDVLFAALPPEKSLIVDNSKKPAWAARFLDRPGFQKRVIHLIRDPRALVRRWDMGDPAAAPLWKQRWRWTLRDPAMAPRFLSAPRRKFFLYKWLGQNRRITDLVRSRGLEHVVMTYRDLALETERELRRVMAWLGLEYEPGQPDYWTVDHHGSQKGGYEWVKTEKRRFFDTRWKDYLAPDEQDGFARDPLVLRYLDGIGVRFVADGLTTAPPGGPLETREPGSYPLRRAQA
jgi:hypothetical protein